MKKLEISIDKNKDTPIYKQIYDCIKLKINRAELVENSKLPSIRQLSIKLKVNNLTILKAYNLLESKGYVYKKHGAGVFVKKKNLLFYFTPPKEVMESFRHRESEYKDIIDFVSGTPSNDILPYKEFKEIAGTVLKNHGAEIMAYHDSQGCKKLRTFLSQDLVKRGIEISENNIQITSGSQQGIDLILKTLLSNRNNKIVVGTPTYHGALNRFRKECKIFGVALEKDGFNLEELEDILSTENIAFIYTMMDFQSPTGISWSNEKRKKLIEMAEKYNTYIVEDDCLSDIYFTDIPKVPLKSMDPQNKRVISIKSYSKVLMPGMRMGYMLLPDELVNQVVTAKFTSDISSSGFEQRILLEFLTDSSFETHVEIMRKLYRSRYQFILQTLEQFGFFKVVYPIDGGFYLWIELPKDVNGNDFYVRCRKKSVSILPGSAFFIENNQNNSFRLSFAQVDNDEILEGISRMAQVIEDIKKEGRCS